jgi:SAM-dependent methyltransferase
LSEPQRVEFTGERVIPGLVEDSLFNEHVARYRFAMRLIRDLGLRGSFVDAGCGAGYGSAQLATEDGAKVLGIDIAEEAVTHAREHYGSVPNLGFERASCTAIPVADGSVRLLTCFEVIEHLADWRALLREAARVLEPGGLFLVSTPNQLYYAESRKIAGPNPFHVHEFTYEEFQTDLAAFFPGVRLLLQNHVEGIALSGADGSGATFEVSERPADPDNANFFLAICGKQTLPKISNFVYLPDTGNVLQTRERHIDLLNAEIRQKEEWIAKEQGERDRMLEKVRETEAELEEHNTWARKANEEAERRARLVESLQEELKRSNEWAAARDAEAKERSARVEQLQGEVTRATEWAKARDVEVQERSARVEQLQAEVTQTTEWAKARDVEVQERSARVEQLQDEVARATEWAAARDVEVQERSARVEQLQDEVARATVWAQERGQRCEEHEKRILELQAEVEEKNRWAQSIREEYEAELQRVRDGYEAAIEQWRQDKKAADDQLELVARSRWVRLGRTLKVGPEIPQS